MLKIKYVTGDGMTDARFLVTEIKLWNVKMGQVFPGRFYFEPVENVYQFGWKGTFEDGEMFVGKLPCSAFGIDKEIIEAQRTAIYAACMSAITAENPEGDILYNVQKQRKLDPATDFIWRILPQLAKNTGTLFKSGIDGKIYFFQNIHSAILYAMNYYAEYMERPFHEEAAHSYGKKLVVALCAKYGGITLPLPSDEIVMSSLCNVDFATKIPERSSLGIFNPICLEALEKLAFSIVVEPKAPADLCSLLYIIEHNGIDEVLIEESKRQHSKINIKIDTLGETIHRIEIRSGEVYVYVKPGVSPQGFIGYSKILNVKSISIITSQD